MLHFSLYVKQVSIYTVDNVVANWESQNQKIIKLFCQQYLFNYWVKKSSVLLASCYHITMSELKSFYSKGDNWIQYLLCFAEGNALHE